MTRHGRFLVALSGAALLLLGSCGGGGTTSAPPSPSDGPALSQGAVPTSEQLASVLVTVDDLDGEWTVNVPPDDEAAISGVVSEAQQGMLPRIEFCTRAGDESQAAADAAFAETVHRLCAGLAGRLASLEPATDPRSRRISEAWAASAPTQHQPTRP